MDEIRLSEEIQNEIASLRARVAELERERSTGRERSHQLERRRNSRETRLQQEMEKCRHCDADSEKQRSEEALRTSEEHYKLLIEQMNEGFVATDADNRCRLVNAKMVEMLGYSREEIYGRSIADFLDADNRRHLEEQEARRRRGLADAYELTFTAKEGHRVDTIASPTPLHDAAGEFMGSFAVVTDITDRKRQEAERLRLESRIRGAQKMESLGVLAGGVAHDFNNLLVGMLGNAGLALLQMPADSPLRPLIEQVETAALRASELTREMLVYSGKGHFTPERIDLSALVEEMVHLLEVTIRKKATLKLDFAPQLPAVEGDPTQIRQVVMNLITNASEAIDGRQGVITIRTGLRFADRAYLARTYLDEDLAEGTYAFLEVTDNGQGMSPETKAKIFDPFFTTKFTGRGLGLAAVLGIVRGHGGAILVDSHASQGTSFHVLLPAVASNEPHTPERHPPDPWPSVERGCVLVVDDEPLVVGVAKASLEQVGFRVLTAGDGQEALAVFQRYEGEIDVVLLDMTMPRMGGMETFAALRRVRDDIDIVLSSGYDEQDALVDFPEHGLARYLAKPYQPRRLIEIMAQVMAHRHSSVQATCS